MKTESNKAADFRIVIHDIATKKSKTIAIYLEPGENGTLEELREKILAALQ